ncbi:MAG TPA: thioredoxin family protein, partial [Thermoplasmatales archaeon]|nr:thioredoxin family protein [Thermoplasmatales archaeon]
MRRKIAAMIILFTAIFIVPIGASTSTIEMDKSGQTIDFTHTVFAEYVTATWCPACPVASQALYNLYEVGETQFYFVSIVYDVNPVAKERSKQFFTVAVPTTYFDGGDKNMVGNVGGNVDMTANAYKSI